MKLIKNCVYHFSHGKKAWYINHVKDEYVKKAQAHNYRSRASFKLLQIEQKYSLLSKSNAVLDLGAAPGSWSQALKTINPSVRVAAVDLLPMAQLEEVDFYQTDARSKVLHQLLQQRYGKFDAVVSDMAPNFSGTLFETHQQILQLNKCCLLLCLTLGTDNCSLVMKTIQGEYQKCLFWVLEHFFQEVVRFKPKASRSQSTQHYLICKQAKLQLNKQQSIVKLQQLDFSSVKSKKQMTSLFD